MSSFYYVNKNAQSNGDHEVHVTGCSWMPEDHNRTSLGVHDNCRTAVAKAKREHYARSDGCAHCCPACHSR